MFGYIIVSTHSHILHTFSMLGHGNPMGNMGCSNMDLMGGGNVHMNTLDCGMDGNMVCV